MNWEKFIGKEEAIKEVYERIDKAQDHRIMEYMFPVVLDSQPPPKDWHKGGASWVAEELGIPDYALSRRKKRIAEAIHSVDTGEAKMRRILSLLHLFGEIIVTVGGPESLREDILQIINRYGRERNDTSPSTYFFEKYNSHGKSGVNRLLYLISNATQIFYRILLRDDVEGAGRSAPTIGKFKKSSSSIPLQKFSRLQTLLNEFEAKHGRAPSHEEVASRIDDLDVETVRSAREDLADA